MNDLERKMDRLEAFDTIRRSILASENNELIEALRVFVEPPPPSPPTGLGRLGGETALLAQQIAKTGKLGEWRTPPNHSQAMERLIHRLANVLEAFSDLADDDGDYLPLLAEVWRMIVQDGATATDVHAAIFHWSVKDRVLGKALVLKADVAAAAATNIGGATS